MGSCPLGVGLEVEDEHVRGGEPGGRGARGNLGAADVAAEDRTVSSLAHEDKVRLAADGADPGRLAETA